MVALMPGSSLPLADLHSRFLALLPHIDLHGRIYFRHLKSHAKAEALQEMRALAWLWFVRLARRGKDPSDFVKAFTTFLAHAINAGRTVTGQAKARDVMNVATQKRQGFAVESLPCSTRKPVDGIYSQPRGQHDQDAFEERLRDNTLTPVPDQAAFRIDWPAWLATRSHRERRIVRDLMAGERTLDVSRKYGLSPARISQLRQQFHEDWRHFIDGTPDRQVKEAA